MLDSAALPSYWCLPDWPRPRSTPPLARLQTSRGPMKRSMKRSMKRLGAREFGAREFAPADASQTGCSSLAFPTLVRNGPAACSCARFESRKRPIERQPTSPHRVSGFLMFAYCELSHAQKLLRPAAACSRDGRIQPRHPRAECVPAPTHTRRIPASNYALPALTRDRFLWAGNWGLTGPSRNVPRDGSHSERSRASNATALRPTVKHSQRDRVMVGALPIRVSVFAPHWASFTRQTPVRAARVRLQAMRDAPIQVLSTRGNRTCRAVGDTRPFNAVVTR